MPGYGHRFWAERTPAHRRRKYPKFRGGHTADAVVVGGGLTGCAAAFALASAGFDVVLLEAERLADGATSGSLGAIVPQPDARFRDVERAAGRRVARTAWMEARRSAREFAAVLRKLSAATDMTPATCWINAPLADEAAGLRKEQVARKAAGIDAAWVTGPAAMTALGTESGGALRLGDAFTFDPVRSALGLATAAQSSGARIFEQSAVRRTRFTRKYAEVVLAAGVIRTRAIIVATGGPGPIVGQLRRHVRARAGYAVVTAPLTAAMRRDVKALDLVITEATDAPHWWRWMPDNRVLFAGAPGPPVVTRARDKVTIQRTAQLMYELSVRYPVISGLPAAWGWDVPVISTPDSLPWIGPHRNYPFHFCALAFGWHGEALAWLAARAAVRYVRGERRPEDDVFGFVRHL
jgi:gamma-glutamylputrescine oxidase